MSWSEVFSGVGGVVVGAVLTAVGFYIKRRFDMRDKQKERAEQNAERLRIDPKYFQPAYLNTISSGVSDLDGGGRLDVNLGLVSAQLHLLCHNQTATPITVDKMILVNVDTMDEVDITDGNGKQIALHSPSEIVLTIDKTVIPYVKPPAWRAMVKIKTIRGGVFCSEVFSFTSLQKPPPKVFAQAIT